MLNTLKDVFASLNAHEVKYLVIGGIAAVLYGEPRATLELDILIEATHNNAARLLDALAKADITSANLTSPEEILSNDVTVFFGWMCKPIPPGWILSLPGNEET